MILCIETATATCSAALCSRSGTVAMRESRDSRSHAALLTVFIREILSEAGIGSDDLEAVAVSKGPGSYTGLRIGVSVAKGISFASSVPLIGIETTFSMFSGFAGENIKSREYGSLFCPMLDARRMEVYYAIYDCNGEAYRNISAGVIDENSFSDIPEEKELIFFGDGAPKLRDVLRRKNIRFADYEISAGHMRLPAYSILDSGKTGDVAYFEPFYLKDFIATKQVKNILGK